MQLDNSAEGFLSELGDPPAARVRYFGDQSSDMKPFQQSADSCGVPPQDVGLLVVQAEKVSNVTVVESMK